MIRQNAEQKAASLTPDFASPNRRRVIDPIADLDGQNGNPGQERELEFIRKPQMPNGSTYDSGTRPHLLINWNSFVAEGIPANWQGPFTDAVINAYTRWIQVAGVDMRPQFWGYTTATAATAGERPSVNLDTPANVA